MNKDYCFSIDVEKMQDLMQLSEEKDVSTIVINALNLYYEIQKFRSKEYRLSFVPFHIETGEVDKTRPPLYFDELI